MAGGDSVTDPSLFNDVFSTEGKKITAVYARRPKKPQPQVSDHPKSVPEATSTAARNGIFVFRDEGVRNMNINSKKNRKSWYNRSLSFRGRRSSLVSTDRQPLAPISSNLFGNPAIVTPAQKPDSLLYETSDKVVFTGTTRRTWAGVPLSYLKEQRAFFADIDAFDLDAKEDTYSPAPKKQQPRDSLDFALSQYPGLFGKAPPRYGTAESTLEGFDLLSAALSTPIPAAPRGRCKNVSVNEPANLVAPGGTILQRNSLWLAKGSCLDNVQEDDLVPSPEISRDRPVTRSSKHSSATFSVEGRSRSISGFDEEGTIRRSSIQSSAKVSAEGRRSRSIPSIDEEVPTSIDASREASPFIGFETGSLLSRLETLQIREEEETEAEFGKISLCTPILEEESEEEEDRLDLSSECDIDEIQVIDLDAENRVEADHLLSVFDTLLQECHQVRLLSLSEALSSFCNLREIKKLGEGTFGEAFKGGGNVFKIVPMDGSFQVNGENQKTSAEIFSEVVLSNTLNKLRGGPLRDSPNICNSFIETKATRICQGCYDPELVRAWEDWDALNTSENDHPLLFPDQQLYVVFVLADGGRDLENFVLNDFNEARSLLLQVVLALAVAEQVCQFEHRDLHWGNIVLARDQEIFVPFRLLGQEKCVKSFGLSVSLIDFTLSRLDTGKQVLFCNLAADPALFEGPNGDVQADTYRRMLKVTNGQWEGRFLKTNCLWIHYVADILINKKAFKCSPQEKRSLRAFRKRVLLYESAETVVQDDFFDGMWAEP